MSESEPSRPAVRARLGSLDELTPADVSRWQELSDRSIIPNPFNEPAFVLPEARHLAGEARVGLIRVLRGDEWLAALPVRRSATWHRVPLPSVSSWGTPEHHFLGAPLVAREAVVLGLGVLVDALRALPVSCFATLAGLPAEGPLASALDEVVAARRVPVRLGSRHERALLRCDAEAPSPLERMSARHRSDLRRRGRLLGEAAGGEPAVRVRHEPVDLERFIALEAAGWKGRTGHPLAHRPCARAFFCEMAAGFAALGRLQLLCLEAGGQTAAMSTNLLAADGAFVLRIAYDERFARCSPGNQLLVAMGDRGVQAPQTAWIDSGANWFNATFNRLWPDRRKIETRIIAAEGARGAVGRAGLTTLTPLHAAAVRAIQAPEQRWSGQLERAASLRSKLRSPYHDRAP
jgi:hypothetical protein